MNECDSVFQIQLDVIEGRIEDDTRFPIVRDTKLKQIFRVLLEFLKVIINYLKYLYRCHPKKQSQR